MVPMEKPIKDKTEYRFYGAERASVCSMSQDYPCIENPRDLYDRLSRCWCALTCAPRMREKWSEENKTLGQCSITAFLVQDIFGGQVYGVPLGDGNYHCFNVVDGIAFDLTSEQFGDVELRYSLDYPQSRDVHFAKREKKERYELLKRLLLVECSK